MTLRLANFRLYGFTSPALNQSLLTKFPSGIGPVAIKLGYTTGVYEDRLREMNRRRYAQYDDWVCRFFDAYHAPKLPDLAGIVAESLAFAEVLRSGGRQIALPHADGTIASEIFAVGLGLDIYKITQKVAATLGDLGIAAKA